MTRSLGTAPQNVRRQIKQAAQEKTRQAFLVAAYKDKMTTVLVTFSPPRLGVQGVVARARISSGLTGIDTTAPQLPAGHPVTVVIRRGQLSIVGF